MQHVFSSWSGGKDSCLATYHSLDWGLEVRFLLTMMNEKATHSWVHHLPLDLLRTQSQAVGIPLLAQKSTMPTYEADFKQAIECFKEAGITGGVFGDMDIEEHRHWVQRTCREAGVYAHLPLWQHDQKQVLLDFIRLGFEAVVVATQADKMGKEWLGRKIDADFIQDLERLRQTREITYCGEVGEYHTCVLNGPIFQKRIEIVKSRRVLRKGYWFLEILSFALREKQER